MKIMPYKVLSVWSRILKNHCQKSFGRLWLAGAVLWLPFQRKRTPFVAWKTSHKKKTQKNISVVSTTDSCLGLVYETINCASVVGKETHSAFASWRVGCCLTFKQKFWASFLLLNRTSQAHHRLWVKRKKLRTPTIKTLKHWNLGIKGSSILVHFVVQVPVVF